MKKQRTLENISLEDTERGIAMFVSAVMHSVMKQSEESRMTMPNSMVALGVNVSKLELLVEGRKRPAATGMLSFEFAVASWMALLEITQMTLEEYGGRKALMAFEERLQKLGGLE